MSSRYEMVLIAGVFLFLLVSAVEAQAPPSLETMMSDAGYVFNRYEELVTGIDCDSWKVPASLKGTCKNNLKSIEANVQSIKPVLIRTTKSKNPDLVDLFEIFQELNGVANHLGELSSNLSDFTESDGVPYAQAGSKALILAAHLGNEIKVRLILQQAKLQRCGLENQND